MTCDSQHGSNSLSTNVLCGLSNASRKSSRHTFMVDLDAGQRSPRDTRRLSIRSLCSCGKEPLGLLRLSDKLLEHETTQRCASWDCFTAAWMTGMRWPASTHCPASLNVHMSYYATPSPRPLRRGRTARAVSFPVPDHTQRVKGKEKRRRNGECPATDLLFGTSSSSTDRQHCFSRCSFYSEIAGRSCVYAPSLDR